MFIPQNMRIWAKTIQVCGWLAGQVGGRLAVEGTGLGIKQYCIIILNIKINMKNKKLILLVDGENILHQSFQSSKNLNLTRIKLNGDNIRIFQISTYVILRQLNWWFYISFIILFTSWYKFAAQLQV